MFETEVCGDYICSCLSLSGWCSFCMDASVFYVQMCLHICGGSQWAKGTAIHVGERMYVHFTNESEEQLPVEYSFLRSRGTKDNKCSFLAPLSGMFLSSGHIA